ncbi:DNA polymerase IV [Haloarcula marismortui ATCC 43049]|uniref:DNA polymerase beta n=1 Tax=Haloarcula marismortui (strain ATCC 43049 / DSM 3752 / JCM 8966 / VKM B-1809) TaxID=272569 RepID=Q5V479_HALMA|nr:DNA polymerase/3'-5' exonuclease PolX [Haloarcula marismortui]AAV45673.1 DNA polymerase IV [Haloarcula marismortui ATCC 43049]QCP90453.1 DNA polymerase/3'-5' exonuclease PolX [Haloarcula marismortui ATCC 43049]
MSRNDEIATLLEEFADLLDAKGVEYKPRAYRRAAENIRDFPGAIEGLAAEGEDSVGEIDAVGDAISSKVVEYVETGEIEELTELREELPVEMDALTAVEGVGPKSVGSLYEALGITTLDELEAAAEAGEIQAVSGFGAKTEQNILDNIDFAREAHERSLLGEARPYGDRIRSYMAAGDAVTECALGGSIRRWRPTIGDVDVLVGSTDAEAVVERFADWEGLDRVIESGETKASAYADDVRVDLRIVDPSEFGAALQYFTGSKDHNVAVRNRAIERDLKVNEYGVFDVEDVEDDDQRTGELVASETEEAVYDALGMDWVPPELRENRGEVEAAANGTLPDLLAKGEVRGDIHTHTNWSDGSNSITEMVEGAAAFGHDYLAVTDHATGPGMVGGVGVPDEKLREQLTEVESVAADASIDVFTGVEANIAADGSVSVADDLLAELDVVVASPHAALDGDGTDRLVAAAQHPDVNVIGHPTGRYLNRREGLDVDVERLASVAADNDTALEINANPARLDLGGGAVKQAVEAGATIAINTDAHSPGNFELLRYGVHMARRGWAETDNVLNTRDAEGLREFLDA